MVVTGSSGESRKHVAKAQSVSKIPKVITKFISKLEL